MLPYFIENDSLVRLTLQNSQLYNCNYYSIIGIGSAYSKTLQSNKSNNLIASFVMKRLMFSHLKLISSKISIANFGIKKNENYGFKLIVSKKKINNFLNYSLFFILSYKLICKDLKKKNFIYSTSDLLSDIKIKDYFSQFSLNTGYQLIFKKVNV